MKRRELLAGAAGAVLAPLAFAGAPADLPPVYVPRLQGLAGRLSIWGHGSLGGRVDFIEALVTQWEQGFARHHPDVRFENRLHGTASAIGALYTGAGDLALMGREIWPMEVAAFREVKGYAPTGVDVVTGSFKTRNRGYAIVVFVHKDNPIRGLTLQQLDAMFGVERRRGGAPVRTWGDVGLTGEWKDMPVQPYSFSLARGFTDYLEEAVLGGSHRWRPDVREFADVPLPAGGFHDGGQRLLEAMASDRAGIGFSGAQYANADVRAIPVSVDAGSPFVAASEGTVMDHSYPLTRIITMFLDRRPGTAPAPHIHEFVRYILSRDAQDAILQQGGGYLPILAPEAARQLAKLGDSP